MHLLSKIVIPMVESRWKKVAYAMGYSTYEVDSIDKNSQNLNQRCENLFTDWLNSNPDATWLVLLKFIKQVDELLAAAEEIEKKIVSGMMLII